METYLLNICTLLLCLDIDGGIYHL